MDTANICKHPNRVEHCWHIAGTYHFPEQNKVYFTCCFCGQKKEEKHGEFLPNRG